MKFSVWPNFARPWDELAALARAVDAQGWHGLWYADHYMGNRADDAVSDDPALECWAALAAVAAITSRVRIGSLVSPTTVHHPALLAKRAATVDQISHGRFTLGLGAGWQVNEHTAYGIEMYRPKQRVDRFEEAIEIVHALLNDRRTNFSGTYFQITDAPCEPKPVQSPLPILVGTSGRRMAGIVARYASDWNMWGTPERLKTAMALLDEACERAGRDPASLGRSAQALVFLAATPAEAAERRKRAPEDRALVGTAAELVDQLQSYVELGLNEFIVPDFTLGRDAAERLDVYSQLWHDIFPQLR